MSLQPILTALLLPPLLLPLCVLAGALLAWHGRRGGTALAAAAAMAELFLATPLAAGLLTASLEREAGEVRYAGATPGAIVVLGAEAARGPAGVDIGPLTLERIRAGAALQRRTGLPLLVTGGPLAPGDPPIAALMARSLESEFNVPVRWMEQAARDTRENAVLSAAILREAGIGAAHVVTHAWHLPRAREAFARDGFDAAPAPVRLDRVPDGRPSDWVPRPDHLGESWFVLREWAGRLVYALRDRQREVR